MAQFQMIHSFAHSFLSVSHWPRHAAHCVLLAAKEAAKEKPKPRVRDVERVVAKKVEPAKRIKVSRDESSTPLMVL